MRVAFATTFDLRDIRRGSGTFFNLAKELERQGHVVDRIGPVQLEVPFAAKLVNSAHRRLGWRHPLFLDPMVGKRTGAQITSKLGGRDYDVLLTNDMSIAAFTTTARPVVLYTDVMITTDYSERNLPGCRLGNMSKVALWLSRKTLRSALSKAAIAVFPAEWSAEAAGSYCLDKSKIKVIPFGANVEDPGRENAGGRTWGKIRAKGRIDLLFVGKDWIRKGGGIAVNAVRILNGRGLKARLHIVGATPPGELAGEDVRQYGMLDKSNPQDAALLNELFVRADAFILPSASEGFVISVLEAAAYGLPALAYDTDGVRNAVVDGRTGWLFPLGSPAEVFADAVRRWNAAPEMYESLALGARRHYETAVNWGKCVESLMECVGLCAKSAARGEMARGAGGI